VHRLIEVIRGSTSATFHCPGEPLRREELDLIDTPANPIMLDDMLPPEAVAVGDKWKIPDPAVAQLLGLEAVSWTDIESVLGEVANGVAEISSAGAVSGAVGGVSTEIELKAKYKFDIAHKRISYFALLIKEKRAIGHIGPGLDTVCKLLMVISPLAESSHLTTEVVDRVAHQTPPAVVPLRYTAVSGQFRFDYEPRWYVTGDDTKLAILRLLDRGELVAQCNVSALPANTKSTPTLEEFQRDIERSLGASFGQFVSASQDTTEKGYRVLRVVAQGTVSQLPIEWIYYLIRDEQGRSVSLAFTFEQELAERFAGADRLIVNQLKILDGPSPTAAREKSPTAPTSQRAKSTDTR